MTRGFEGLPRVLLLAGAVAGLSGCAMVGVGPVAPAPLPQVDLDPSHLVAGVDDWAPLQMDAARLAPPPDDSMGPDPILQSPVAQHPQLSQRIDFWVARWQRRGNFDMPVSLGRMSYYGHAVDAEIEARGLPRSLRYLPIIESGYYPTALSRAGASGLWQLMAGTARNLGLSVNSVVDERRDPFSSTAGALTFLQELNTRFPSWYLTLAAYNAGPYRIEGLLRKHAPNASVADDATYMLIRPFLPTETQDFVPKFLAAAQVGENPERFGFQVARMEPLTFDEVSVPDAATVDVLARAADASPEVIRQLNPHLLRGMTPGGVATRVRVPQGRAELFATNWEQIPASERISFLEHRIAKGETLSGVASRYRVSLSELQGANPGLDARRLRIGQSIVIPTLGATPGLRTAANPAPAPPPAAAPAPAARREATPAPVTARGGDGGSGGAPMAVDGGVLEPAVISHRVASGESLWTIARRYGVTVNALRGWNNLTERSVLRAGQTLSIRTGGEGVAPVASAPAAAPRVHVVRSGDTLGAIAIRYGVSSAALARENGITVKSTIRPGQRLTVPTAP